MVLATLRLAPVVPTKVAMAQFPDVEHAVSAVQEILNTPHGPHIRKFGTFARAGIHIYQLFSECVELLDDHSELVCHEFMPIVLKQNLHPSDGCHQWSWSCVQVLPCS